MRITKECIERIRDAADIVDVCGAFLPDLKKSGNNYVACSPKTNEKTPSFHAIPHLNKYKDFSHTQRGETFGDSINFLMVYQNLTYVQALEWLANRYGIQIERKAIRRKPDELEQRINAQYEVAEWGCKMFQKWLINDGLGSKGLDYLQVRGVSPELIEHYRLGFAPDAFNAITDSAKQENISREILRKVGLISITQRRRYGTHYYDFFRDRVMFPITDARGRVIGFGGRLLPGDQEDKNQFPKYVNSPESNIFKKGSTFFGLYQAIRAIRQEGKVYLVEGYMDVLAFASVGIFNVVSLNGTALRENAVRELARFTKNFVIVMDGDAAGQKAIQYVLPILLSVLDSKKDGDGVNVVIIPDDMDPDEYIGKHGEQSFRELLNSEKDFVATVIEHEWARHGNSPSRRAHVLSNLIKTILYCGSELLQQEYLMELIKLTGINAKVIEREVQRLKVERQENMAPLMEKLNKQKPSSQKPSPAAKNNTTERVPQPQVLPIETLLKIMVKFGAREYAPGITYNMFILKELEKNAINVSVPFYRKILLHMSDKIRTRKPIDKESMLAAFPTNASQVERFFDERMTLKEMAYTDSNNDLSKLLNEIKPHILELMIENLADDKHRDVKSKLIELKNAYPV